MDTINCIFRKITKDEFDRLHNLFPDSEQMWLKFRDIRWKEFDNREIDIYVIERNGIFIGELTIHYISHDLASETIPGQRVYLQAFRLDKKYQGVGLGQKLLQFALTDLEQKGYTEFTIGVEEDNEKAKHIYFKLGFTEAIDKGLGDEFDPSDYTLYLRKTEREQSMFYNKAATEDIEQLTELRIAYLIEDNGKLEGDDLEIIKRNLPAYFLRNLNKNIFGYVVRDGKDIIACALLLVIEKPLSPAFITGKTGTVLNVYTKVEYRHHGYARKVMNMLMDDAVAMGLSVVELKATESGYPLYKSLGFQDTVSKYHLMNWSN